jgi:hypothetical protein
VSDFVKLDDAENELPFDAKEWTQVLDRDTGLIWTADNAAPERINWKKAKNAAATCNVGGATDWRLPTVKELISIVDYGREDPAIDADFFRCESIWYWSASPCAWSPGSDAWLVSFYNGYVHYCVQSGHAFVRAVRSRAAHRKVKP